MPPLLAALMNSLRGLRFALRSERAVRQEALVLVVSLPVALLVARDRWTALALVVSVLLVLAVELLNTGLEKLCDHVTPEHHEAIGRVKDLGSAAVLASLVIAGLVWAVALLEAVGL